MPADILPVLVGFCTFNVCTIALVYFLTFPRIPFPISYAAIPATPPNAGLSFASLLYAAADFLSML